MQWQPVHLASMAACPLVLLDIWLATLLTRAVMTLGSNICDKASDSDLFQRPLLARPSVYIWFLAVGFSLAIYVLGIVISTGFSSYPCQHPNIVSVFFALEQPSSLNHCLRFRGMKDGVQSSFPILSWAFNMVEYNIVIKGVGQRQSHFLAPFINFIKDLLSAYVPCTGDTVVNETGC